MADEPAAHGETLTAPPLPTVPAPVGESERYAELDLLRGFAVLGILAMNIRSFAGPFATYMNPTLEEGFHEGASRAAYIATSVVFDTKMMSLFSMLFGAGAVVWMSKRAAGGGPAVGLWMRRMLWLLVIGCVHAYLIWEGDILVAYAVCGVLLLWWARRLPAWLLLVGGAVMLAIGGLLWAGIALQLETVSDEAERARILGGLRGTFEPGPERLAEQMAVFTGPYAGQVRARAPGVWSTQTKVFVLFVFWRAGGMMLIGAALMRLGVLSGARRRGLYLALGAAGLAVGGALAAVGVLWLEATDYAVPGRMVLDMWNYFGSALMAVGYAAGLIWLHKSGALGAAGRALAATGRMAFTNYLAQSLICTTIFYGHGLGLFGRFDYAEQLLVVAGVWALQLAWSPWWLSRFHFGPMEWAWRSLTYWRVQPMARRAVRAPGAP